MEMALVCIFTFLHTLILKHGTTCIRLILISDYYFGDTQVVNV